LINLPKFEILFFPPFGDSASGPFAEAIWLVKNSFNYVGLAKQPGFIDGGPKVYLFSIYPTFLALQMKLFSNAKIFLLINHIFLFIFGSITVSYFREILLRITTKEKALLTSVFLISLPVFQNQVETINMEMPLAMFSMLAVYYLSNKNLLMAGIMSILAAMAKGVGIFVCGTVAVISIILFIVDEKLRFKPKTALCGAITLIFLVVKYYAAFFILYDKGEVADVGAFQGLKLINIFWISKVYLGSAAIFMELLLFQKFKIPQVVGYIVIGIIIGVLTIMITAYYGIDYTGIEFSGIVFSKLA